MNDTETMKTIESLKIFTSLKQREENEKELIKIRAFYPPKTKDGGSLLYRLKSEYILTNSPIAEYRQALRFFATAIIKNKTNGMVYYLIPMPADTRQKYQIREILSWSRITITTALRLKDKDSITTAYLKRPENLPYYHEGRITLMREKFEELDALEYTTYRPPKEPKFPLFFNSPSTAEDFINQYAKRGLYPLYAACIKQHIAYSSHLYKQYGFNSVAASSADIRKLMPHNMSISQLTEPHKKQKVEQLNNHILLFTYDMESLRNSYKMQRVSLPMWIFSPTIFKAENLSNQGLPFLLAFLYGYHLFTNPQVNYKLSTLIKLARLNTNRGHAHLLTSLNKKLAYVHSLGILQDKPNEITLEDLKEDRTVKYYLTPLSLLLKPKELKS